MKCALILSLVATALAVRAEGADLYPEIRAIIREAELAAGNIPVLDDRSKPSEWAARLYAQAGYLDDAARAFGQTSIPYYPLLKARVLYGDMAGAEKSLNLIQDPEQKAKALTAVADLLWRMGEPSEAKLRLNGAKEVAERIADAEHRKRVLASIEQGSIYMGGDPPDRLSSVPKPRPRLEPQDSPVPQFPITPQGFGDLDPKEVAGRTSADSELMKDLYGRMAAHDREGIQRIIDTAATPFRKALAIASIEHIFIQASEPELAEQYAKQISQSDPVCSLAKAEALSAAAAAWLRAENAGQAQLDFEAAINLARSVKELPFGRVSVITSVAAAQAKGGMTASSGDSLKLAEQMAQDLPLRPAVRTVARTGARAHYRDEAYKNIFLAATRAHNLGAAHAVTVIWEAAGGKNDIAIVEAWLNTGQKAEAIALAENIHDSPERVKTLLYLAEILLELAGAPNF